MNYSITNDMIRGLIREMPNGVFDSHALIFRAMQQYPQQFTRDLFLFVDCDDPIQQHNASFAKRLLGIDEIEPTEKVPSMNVRGETTENQQWRRK